MSGGTFDYIDYQLKILIDEMTDIKNEQFNFIKDDNDIDFVMKLYNDTIKQLELNHIILHRLDLYLAGDDRYDTFIEKLYHDLMTIKNEN